MKAWINKLIKIKCEEKFVKKSLQNRFTKKKVYEKKFTKKKFTKKKSL
jgi:hypothetical protein